MDVWGPYQVPSINDFRYFLTVVDDCTRSTWIFMMRCKSETVLHIKNFVLLIRNQFAKTIKICRTDNGTEFINASIKEFFTQLGIVHQTRCTHTPQQNGIVRHVLEVARALKIQSGIPDKYWNYCILTACYLINAFPSTVLHGCSPYESLYKRKFDA